MKISIGVQNTNSSSKMMLFGAAYEAASLQYAVFYMQLLS